jgi:molecular chaperone DnaK
MVKDAESHAAEDKKFHELVNARNHADNLIHATNKSIKELGDKVEENEKKDIESAIEALHEAMKGDDKQAIESKTEALQELAGKLAERVYKQQAESGAAAGSDDQHGPGGGQASGGGDDVVDAEFEEVNENTK